MRTQHMRKGLTKNKGVLYVGELFLYSVLLNQIFSVKIGSHKTRKIIMFQTYFIDFYSQRKYGQFWNCRKLYQLHKRPRLVIVQNSTDF